VAGKHHLPGSIAKTHPQCGVLQQRRIAASNAS
jgi:hypothetical protein